MNTNFAIEPEVVNDTALVELSLDGDRDAFGQLVARYQSAICAMGFSACGNVERSEDIAQEVFVTAWRKLSALSEPGKFKQWLYGIARNLIHNSFREEIRNPVGGAEQFEDGDMVNSDLPDGQAISNEEQAILWHVLSGLPQIYREPMVLFYRQNESVPAVADTLGISEEAVRQRLSRGRLLLAERVTRVIRSGLRRSGPGPLFAVAVVGSLPIIAAATTAKGAVMGMGAAKGAGGNAGWFATLKTFGIFAGVLAIPAAIGGLIGRKLGKDAEGSPSQQAATRSFWRAFSWVVGGLIFLPLMLALFGAGFFPKGPTRMAFLSAMERWIGFSYIGVVVLLAYWIWLRRRAVGEASATAATEPKLKRPAKMKWVVACVTAGALGLLVFCLCDMNFKIQHVSPADIATVVKQNNASDLHAWVLEYHARSLIRTDPNWKRSDLWLEVHKNGTVTRYDSLADDTVIASIKAKGLECPTYVQGRDFEILGWPGRLLPFVAVFVVGLGAVYLIKTRRAKAKV